MRYFFFDTETTGLPNDRYPIDHPDQPHIVQIAALLCDENGDELQGFSLIVNPGVQIPANVAAIHGITTEIAEECGCSLETAVETFREVYTPADMVVAHNVKFDRFLIETAIARHYQRVMPLTKPLFCTMETSAPIINLPPSERMIAAGFNKPKSPKLAEAVKFFFGEELDGAHDALVDVRACSRVFFKLKELGHVH